MLLHIAKKADWNQAIINGQYTTDSLNKEGFIHCSLRRQVIRVADYNYKHEKDLVLLVIDETMLTSDVVYEDLYNIGEKYPHIYGTVNLNSVIGVHNFNPRRDGTFSLPRFV